MIKLSVLIPSIPERAETLRLLLEKLESQISENSLEDEVEIIALIDNKKVSIGMKRERLKNMAQGKYFCFVDDDDGISEDYVKEIVEAINNNNVDVICFNTFALIEDLTGVIEVSINNPENEQFKPNEITLRKPSHVNAWLTEKFKKYAFGDSNYGEDFDFCNLCYPHIVSGYNINKILHFYTFDKKITQAF